MFSDNGSLITHLLRGFFNRINNLLISGASAKIAGYGSFDIFSGGLGILF
jgi:hypothetical protein